MGMAPASKVVRIPEQHQAATVRDLVVEFVPGALDTVGGAVDAEGLVSHVLLSEPLPSHGAVEMVKPGGIRLLAMLRGVLCTTSARNRIGATWLGTDAEWCIWHVTDCPSL